MKRLFTYEYWLAAVGLLTLSPEARGQCTLFQPATSYGLNNDTFSVAVGDFNKDGNTDLVTANFSRSTVAVLLGDGTGSFAPAVNFGVGSFPGSVAVGDFNKDGNSDLVTANQNNTVSVLLGDGTGSFAPATSFGVGSFPGSVAVGDFNKDGNPDLVTANYGISTDNFVSSTVSVLLGDGTGRFASAVNFRVGHHPGSVTVGDFNKDGNSDLVTTNQLNNTVSVLLGNGAGSFATAVNFGVGTLPFSVAVGDFNKDDKPDLVTANYGSNTVSVLLGDGAGSFAPAVNFGAGGIPSSVAVGDLDGDNKSDLTVTNRFNNTVSVLLGDGTGSFISATSFGVGNSPNLVAIGDFNGDQKPDLVTANYLDRNVSVLLNGLINITRQPASVSAVCAGATITTAVSASKTVSAYQWYKDGTLISSQTSATLTLTNVQPAQSGNYIVVLSGCTSLTSVPFNLIVNPPLTPYALTGGGAYCPGGSGVVVGLSGSQTGGNYQLQRNGNPVGAPLAGTGSALSFGNQTTAGTYTVLATNASTSCQQAMNGSTTVTITPLPSAPSLVTTNGYPYPAGQNNLTIAQNVGPVSLTVLGCSEGMIMANGNAASSFTVSTAMTGTQTYTATCTQGGCTSPAGNFQLTVVPTTLSVLHHDADYGNTQNNIIKPYLQLANAGGTAIPYGELTVRYWFTSEGQAPPTNLAVYYAQLGAVNMKYVALSQPRQGAFGYVEYSFPGGGNLAASGNSGPIENGIQKTDGSTFNESDDYSYQANYQNYVSNARVTAYRNGTIIWGQEPTMVQSQTAVAVYSAAKDGTTTSQIQTRLELRNTGNTALPISSLKLRYYFTSDNNQPASVYVDYADMGAPKVVARVVKLAAPVEGADSYVELSFPSITVQVNALSSLGVIDFRLVRSDNNLFNQSNDYSYAGNYGNVGLNNRVTVLLDNRLIFGTPPTGAPARLGATEPGTELAVQVLGNPVVGDQAQLLIRGVAGQAVSLRLVDLQGHTIHEQRIGQAGETESVSLPLGQSRGQLLLRVSTESQQQSVKLLRP